MDAQRKIVEKLIIQKLGLGSDAKAKELTQDLIIQEFSPYLFKGKEGCTVLRSDYQPRILKTYSGEHYYRPDGWVQFRWQTWGKCFDDEWPIAYHGTNVKKVPSVLGKGLCNPLRNAGSISIAHGQAGAGSCGAIYVTPSLWLAALPVYAELFELSPEHWVQFVVKVRVRPGSFERQGNTLGLRHYSTDVMYDPNFADEPQEWLLTNKKNIRIVGLMMREFGPAADANAYGQLVRRVVAKRGEGVEYNWTRILCNALRAGNFLRESGKMSTFQCGLDAPRIGTVTAWFRTFSPDCFDRIAKEVQQMDYYQKPLYRFTSPKFQLGSLGKAFWSLSFHGKWEEHPMVPTLDLHLPPGSQFSLHTKIASCSVVCSYDTGANQEFADIETREFLWVSCLEDEHEVELKYCLTPEFFSSQLPNFSVHVAERFEVAGNINISGERIEWKLVLGACTYGRSIYSPAFPLGNASTARLEMYPMGLFMGASDCSLYMWPDGVGVACLLTVACTSRILDCRLEADVTNRNAYWGFDAFCPIQSLPKKGVCTVIVEVDSGPSCPPQKRFKGGPALLGA